jgi:hypothetical protein
MKRAGSTKTITISMDIEIARFAEREAKKRCDGNVSQFFGILLQEARRLAAMDRVLASAGHKPLSDAELDVLRKEVAPYARRKRAA